MITVYRATYWKIAVYGRDHGLPHFHIEGPEFRASIAIATLDLIIGSAPTAVLEEALDWATGNQAALMQKWKELNG
jgi:hypothetical protein